MNKVGMLRSILGMVGGNFRQKRQSFRGSVVQGVQVKHGGVRFEAFSPELSPGGLAGFNLEI